MRTWAFIVAIGLWAATLAVAVMYNKDRPHDRPRSNVQHAVLAGLVALVVAWAVMAVIYYLVPSLHLWRGVAALAAILTGLAILAARAVWRSVR